MGTLTVFVQYYGNWDTSNEYVHFKVGGILLSLVCNINVLKQLIEGELKLSTIGKDICKNPKFLSLKM